MVTQTLRPPGDAHRITAAGAAAALVGLAAMLVALRVRSGLAVGFVVAFAIFVPTERLLALRPRQRVLRPRFWSDVVHFSVNTMLTNVGIIAVVVLAVALLHIAPSAALQERVLAQPGWLQFLEVMTISEVCGYWAHRATHRVPLLWRFHRVHHSIEEMDWLAAARLHPVDQVFTRGCAILPLYALGFSRVAFGGLLVLLTFQALFIHANVRLDLGFLKHVVATPQFHHWHHTNEPGSVDHNFAGGLPLLDRLFGTLLLPQDNRFPAVYGTDDPLPSSWAGQMAAPFRRAA